MARSLFIKPTLSNHELSVMDAVQKDRRQQAAAEEARRSSGTERAAELAITHSFGEETAVAAPETMSGAGTDEIPGELSTDSSTPAKPVSATITETV